MVINSHNIHPGDLIVLAKHIQSGVLLQENDPHSNVIGYVCQVDTGFALSVTQNRLWVLVLMNDIVGWMPTGSVIKM